MFIHQIPPKPDYLRMKVGRRLARIGSIAIKSTVYVMPRTDAAQEDLHWIAREIVQGKGEATLCEARFVDGVTDGEVEQRFRDARDGDYAVVADQIRKATKGLPPRLRAGDPRRASIETEIARCERRLVEITHVDFFSAPRREPTFALLDALKAIVAPAAQAQGGLLTQRREDVVGKTWVTRAGVHVDRIATAWLVRRHVDANAHFKFVPPKGYKPLDGEVRFDMFAAEFTHEGDDCSFEVLRRRLGLEAPGLEAIAEIVHDIDLKDGKFARPETAGVAAAIAGLALRHREDDDRLDRGFELFDDLCAYFARRKNDA